MRQIKFRGKSNGTWVYGSLCTKYENEPEAIYIIDNDCTYHKVESESIGQFIGLLDMRDREIYEGDIVEINDEFFKIYFNERSAGFQLDRLGMEKASNEFISNVIDELEVVGNIYENPDISNDFNNGFRCKVKW